MTDTAHHLANRRRIPVVHDARAPVVSPATIAGPEWTETKGQAALAATQVYDTRAYGSLQAAIDAAHTNGGGEVFIGGAIPPGQSIVLKDKVYLNGRGVGATEISVSNIAGAGEINVLPDLASNVSKGARTVTFASAHGLAAGDVIAFDNPVDSSFSTSRTYYRAGEFAKVAAVPTSTTVLLTTPTYDSYATSDGIRMWQVDLIRTGISNMTINCTTGVNGVSIEYGGDVIFSNLVMRGTDYAHINLARCYGVTITNVKAFDYQDEVGLNYGIAVGNSQRVRLNNCELETTRHGLVTGHGGGPGTTNAPCLLPVRDLIVSDSYISGMSQTAGVCGCNLHGNSEWVRFVNCTFPAGANPAGDHIEYRDCTFGAAPWGAAVQCMEMLGVNLSFIGCTFRANDEMGYEAGLIHLRFQLACTRPHGTLVFAENIVDLGATVSDGGTHNALVIRMVTDVGSLAVRRAVIRDNEFDAASTSNRQGTRIVTLGSTTWTHISYKGNDGRLAQLFDFSNAGTLVFFEGHGSDIPAFAAQRGSTYLRRVSAGTDTGRLYVNQSGLGGTAGWTIK